MKGVLIFNHMDDIAFMSTDDEYNNYLKKRARDEGFIKESDLDLPLDLNVILQMFSPLLASQRFTRNQLNNSYHSVKCQTGFLFCFQQFADECYIAINGDGTETEQFLHHKLRVLHSILGFLLGPVSQAIRPDKIQMREDRWGFVSLLLTTWCDLYRTEQCFLVEAIERLQVNDELKSKCVKLLESALTSARAAGLKYTVHSLLLVNNKLLALYSSRHSAPLVPVDLLKLLLLINTIFPHPCCHDDDLVGSLSSDVAQGESRERQLFSTSTPADGQPASRSSSTASSPQVTDDSLEAKRPPQLCEPTATPAPCGPHRRLFPEQSPSVAHSSTHSLLQSIDSASNFLQQTASFYRRLPVFLQSDGCAFNPHICHCVELMPGIYLIILNEISRASHAGVICKALDAINRVLHRHLDVADTNCSPGGSTSAKEKLDASIQRLQEVSKIFKGARQVETVMSDICSKWKRAEKCDFDTIVSSDSPVNPRLESLLGRLRDRLEELFKLLYLLPRRQAPEVQVNITQGIELVGDMLRRHLVDYSNYLMVKSFHNITMTGYQQDFHGLVHFIYVNRLTGQLTTPSMNKAGPTTDTEDSLQLLLWQKMEWLRERLTDGYTSALVRDGSYVYSYFVWFENKLGHPVKFQQPFKRSKRRVEPGALSEDFYREMVLQCFPEMPSKSISCFELFCVSNGRMTTPQILRQDRKLVATLQQMTREASGPINLL